jgi:L-ribulokinase
MSAYTLGIDFGTNSVRTLLVRCSDGYEAAVAVSEYPNGDQGVLLDSADANLARQHPGDYLVGLEQTARRVLDDAAKSLPDFAATQVIGIGVDSTGSSPIPVDKDNAAIGMRDELKDNLAAQCWLWKDHTSHEEAARITELASQHRPEYLAKCGGTYSSEWWWSKIWHCLNSSPEVFRAAHSWVELADWIPSVLAGVENPLEVKRGVCAAGHKAMYSTDWGGLPDREFLSLLDPDLASLRSRLYETAYDASVPAGHLYDSWASRLGLSAGIPIAIGEFDVHYGAIGSGVDDGVLVKVIGTSTCDCTVVSADHVEDIPGICGIVPGAILPGYYGIEAGQSAVGDIFKWWVEVVCQGSEETHAQLTSKIESQAPGAHGLLALDWNNGNRTILVDQRLTGLLVGQTLQTTRAEIYRALIEATAFGARMILDRIASYGVPVERIVCCGGIAEKNPVLMQIYADITGREMQIAESNQACALGAAVAAAVVAGPTTGGYSDFKSAQKGMTGVKPKAFQPDQTNHRVYSELFELYRLLHDAFGGVETVDMSDLMKRLLSIKERQRGQ